MELDRPEHFINRELSWLKFNSRVMDEAKQLDKPVLERLKFIAITSSNLDEFFMIRVAGLKSQLEAGVNKFDAAGLTVRQQVDGIGEAAHELVKEQYKVLRALLAELTQHEIIISEEKNLPEKARHWVEQYFRQTVYPVITPLAVDASHPFPFLASRSLNLAVLLLRGKDEEQLAVIQVPAVLPRLVEVPNQGKKRTFLFLEDIIQTHCQALFKGYKIKEITPFRITRNADLTIDEDDAEDLMAEVEKSLRQRKRGDAVRLEIARQAGKMVKQFLMDGCELEDGDIYEINGPIDASCFFKFTALSGYDHLRYEPLTPQIPAALKECEDFYALIKERDMLLHHPYESFEPVVDFIRQAAQDPSVLAIKQTLYRVSGNSPIVRALAQAAENGKQVTVVVELKARFDEENNIQWARRLEEAGCHVIYGLVGLKTHAKMALVVRQEGSGIQRYVHMGTGNYNDTTAKIYADLSLFTANDQFGADASAFFNMLSGYSDPPVWNKLVVAPFDLREKLEELIERESEFAEQGQEGRIIAKLNSLIDKGIMLKLYEAASRGVKIDLIVRGICGIRPGIEGVGKNISIHSIVGRFLEHHRILYLNNGGDPKVFLSSADWMHRNLNERVELLFPLEDEHAALRVTEMLDVMLRDNCKSHHMKSDGHYRRPEKRSAPPLNSQEEFYRQAKAAAKSAPLPLRDRVQPLYRKDI
ncbi:RNA degradosome polyphosphate kinase [Azotosporobacter soli]|uniref:RNA degradosome polyphosphate kinase n=1 Tax=Azotosporobacter soli TaxID=3055040 RepID=UPI0031FE8757